MNRKMTKLVLCALLGLLPAVQARADGAVYAMTNHVGNNQIVVFHRAIDGTLTQIQTIATGGGGGGAQLAPPVDSLGSQGGLRLDEKHHLLFAVNTESLAENTQDCQDGTITSFVVGRDGKLSFADRVLSGGLYPDSLTVKKAKRGDLLYVLNAGGPGANPACGRGPNIMGFKVNKLGFMTPLSGSMQAINPGPLNGTGSGVNCPVGGFPVPDFNCGRNPPAFPRSPAQVQFTPRGDQLIVTVKGTNTIYVFRVGKNGRPRAPTITQAPGPALPTYFGIAFDKKDHMLVTEAFGKATSIPMPGAGATSSFTVSKAGTLSPISASIGDQGTAACWIAIEQVTGNFVYVGNNLSNNISSYSIAADGSLKLLSATAATGSGPNDLATVKDSDASYLYALDSGSGTIGAFQINTSTGALSPLRAVGGLPVNDSAQGLAAY